MAKKAQFDQVGMEALFKGLQEYLTNVNAFVQANTKAANSVQKAGSSSRAGARDADLLSHSLRTLGRDAVAVGLGVGALSVTAQALRATIGSTVGAAISFEDSFTGIRKTVDATEQQFKDLEKANRELAKTKPIDVDTINKIGEMGGALGVAAQDVLKFEQVVADLANTTNLTAEAAATVVAQVSNIFGLSIQESDRFGAALVDLGNKSAATEAQIADFTLRIGGAGKIAGLSVAQVEGIGAAFASVGIQAEAGGTAIQKVLISIAEAANTGGDKLGQFAEVAGLTADEFANLFKKDPAEAFVRFVEGLGKAGQEAFGIIKDLDLNDARLLRSFLGVANAGELLRKSIETGTEAYRENTALTTEANKRYATTASQLKILANNFRDAGISLGDQFLPAINKGSAGLVEILDASRPLGPVFEVAAKAALLLAAALAAMKLSAFANSVGTAATAVNALAVSFEAAAVAIGPFAVGLGVVAVAIQAFQGESFAQQLVDTGDAADNAAKKTNDLADAIKRLSEIGATGTGADVADALLKKLQDTNAEIDRIFAANPGGLSSKQQDRLNELLDQIENIRKAALQLLDTLPPDQAFQFAVNLKLTATGGDFGLLTDEVKTKIAEIQKAMEEKQAGGDPLGLGKLGKTEVDVTEKTDKATDAFNTQIETLKNYGDAIKQAQSAITDRVDSVAEALDFQIQKLEQEKRAAVQAGQGTDLLDQRIDSLKNTLEAHNAQAKLAAQGIAVFGARAYDAFRAAGKSGAEATQLVQGLSHKLEDLPLDLAIKIGLALPDLQIDRFLRFLDYIQQGFTVDVALRIATATPGEQDPFAAPRQNLGPNVPPGFIVPGQGFENLPGAQQQHQAQVAQALVDEAAKEAKKHFEDIAQSSEDTAGNFAKADSSSKDIKDRVTQVLEAVMDGVIDLSEATKLGLSDEAVVTLELAKARGDAENAAYRERIEMEKFAKVMTESGLTEETLRLSIGLKAISDHLKETGQTINQFIYETAANALKGFQDAFNAIFSRPTRETLLLQQQLAGLQLTRLRRKAAGATDKDLEGLDKQIQKIEDVIAIKEKEAELLKLKVELDDQTVQSEKDVVIQADLLRTAIANTSQQVKNLEAAAYFDTLAHLNVGNAANDAAESLRHLASVNYFNSLNPTDQHNLALLLQNMPHAAAGGIFTRPTVAVVGEGGQPEIVATPQRILQVFRMMPPQLSAGTPATSVFAPSVNLQQPQDVNVLRRELHRMVDEFVTGSTSRASRLSTSLRSGIG